MAETGLQKGRHSAFAIALFIIGNSVAFLPLTNISGGSLIAFGAAVAVSLPMYLLFAAVGKRMRGMTLTEYIFAHCGRVAAVAVSVFIAIAAFGIALVSCRNHLSFVDVARLPDTPKAIIAILFLSAVFVLASSPKKAVLKLALTAFIVIAVCVTVLFILSLPNMHLSYARSFYRPGIGDIAKEAGAYISSVFSVGAMMLCFLQAESGAKSFKVWLIGFVAGAALILICLMNAVLMFSEGFISQLDFPYMSAMSVISLGFRFSRMEGLSYIIFFICALLRVSVLIIVARDALAGIFPIGKKLLTLILCAVAFGFGIMPGLPDFILNTAVETVKFILCIAVPFIPLIIKKRTL